MDFHNIREAQHEAAQERKAARRDAVVRELKGEYLNACLQPMIATVSTPGMPRRRAPILEVFQDGLDYRHCAAIIGILGRSEEGKSLLAELAEAHAEFFADEVNQ